MAPAVDSTKAWIETTDFRRGFGGVVRLSFKSGLRNSTLGALTLLLGHVVDPTPRPMSPMESATAVGDEGQQLTLRTTPALFVPGTSCRPRRTNSLREALLAAGLVAASVAAALEAVVV